MYSSEQIDKLLAGGFITEQQAIQMRNAAAGVGVDLTAPPESAPPSQIEPGITVETNMQTPKDIYAKRQNKVDELVSRGMISDDVAQKMRQKNEDSYGKYIPGAEDGSLAADGNSSMKPGSSIGFGVPQHSRLTKNDQGLYNLNPNLSMNDKLKGLAGNAEKRYEDVKKSREESQSEEEKLYDMASQKADDYYNQLEERQGKLNQMQSEYEHNEKVRKEKVEFQYKELNKAVDNYKNTRIDPNRLVKSMSTSAKFTAGLGILFGGIASGLQTIATHRAGENVGLRIIDKAIDRDINAQVTELNKKGNLVHMKSGLLRDLTSMTKDQRAAELLTRKMYYENTATKIEMEMSKYKAPEIKQQAQIAAAHFRDKASREDMNFYNHIDAMNAGMAGGAAKVRSGGGGKKKNKDGISDVNMRDLSKRMEALDSVDLALDGAANMFSKGGVAEGYDRRNVQHTVNVGILSEANAWNPKRLFGAVDNDKQALEVSQNLYGVVSQYLFMTSGKAVSEPEARRKTAELFGDFSPASIQRGLAKMKADLAARRRSIRGGYKDTENEAFDQRRGARTPSPIDAKRNK